MSINCLLLALNLAQVSQICHFVLDLPIELTPSKVLLVPHFSLQNIFFVLDQQFLTTKKDCVQKKYVIQFFFFFLSEKINSWTRVFGTKMLSFNFFGSRTFRTKNSGLEFSKASLFTFFFFALSSTKWK